ncbi:hypothetical protein N431DRAFT_560528 [Stipitochalara longipes BDJ]|nr:hypothetical protein N431DRAFT_560528 [Stipitochalara longipes BDJ]
MARSRVIGDKSALANRAIQRRIENTPTALPSRRPRSLTFPGKPDVAYDALKPTLELNSGDLAAEAPQPGFFSIPLEIRRAIYLLSFSAPEDENYSGKSVIQLIQTKENKLYYVTCPWHGHSWNYTRCFRTESIDDEGPVPHQYDTEHFTWCGDSSEGWHERTDGMIRVLMVCRQIYREAVEVLYGSHQFYLRHLFTVIDLSRTVLPQRMNTIHSLRLVIPLTDAKIQDILEYRMARLAGDEETTMHKTFRIIASMEGLKELDVEFEGNIGRKPGRKVELLLPLAMVRQTRRFDVKVPWGIRGREDKLGEVPYRLFWAEGRSAYDGEDDSLWEEYGDSELEGGDVSDNSEEGVEVEDDEAIGEEIVDPEDEVLSRDLEDDTLGEKSGVQALLESVEGEEVVLGRDQGVEGWLNNWAI